MRRPRQPRLLQLPEGDIKIVLRPCDGLNTSRASYAQLRDDVFIMRRRRGRVRTCENILCLNPGQNVMVASTPMIENAKRYSSIKKIHIGNNAYAMMTCTRRRSRTHRKAWFTTPPTKTHKKTSREVWSTRRIPQFSRRDEWVIQARSSSSLKGPECRTTCTTTARNISAFCTRKR